MTALKDRTQPEGGDDGESSPTIRPGGILLTDPKYVETRRKVDAKKLELPIYVQVMEKIGKPIVCNICMLGALVGIADIIEP